MSDMTPVERRIRDDEALGFNLVRCIECGQRVHLLRARLGLCLSCHDERYGRKFVSNGGDEMTIVYDPKDEEER
jgi:hypothetical protein